MSISIPERGTGSNPLWELGQREILDQMNMIRHQTIGIDPAAQLRFAFPEVVEITLKIFVGGKNNVSIVSALNNMVGRGRHDNATAAWHGCLVIPAFLVCLSHETRQGITAPSRCKNKSLPLFQVPLRSNGLADPEVHENLTESATERKKKDG